MKGKRLSQKYAEGYNSHLLGLESQQKSTKPGSLKNSIGQQFLKPDELQKDQQKKIVELGDDDSISEEPQSSISDEIKESSINQVLGPKDSESSEKDIVIENLPSEVISETALSTGGKASKSEQMFEDSKPLKKVSFNSSEKEDRGELEQEKGQVTSAIDEGDQEKSPSLVPNDDIDAKKAKRLEKMKRRLEKKKAKQKEKVVEKEKVPEPLKDEDYGYSKSERSQYMSYIWEKYDKDNSDYLDAQELKCMIDNYSKKNVPMDLVHQFLEQVDEDGDSKIQRLELVHFVDHGVNLSNEDRQEYASRGELQAAMIDFFIGFEEEKEAFKQGTMK